VFEEKTGGGNRTSEQKKKGPDLWTRRQSRGGSSLSLQRLGQPIVATSASVEGVCAVNSLFLLYRGSGVALENDKNEKGMKNVYSLYLSETHEVEDVPFGQKNGS